MATIDSGRLDEARQPYVRPKTMQRHEDDQPGMLN
jgi:hypothetical protein